MDNVNDFLKKMDKSKMLEYIKKAKQFASTEDGKKTIEDMKKTAGGDIGELIKAFTGNPELAEKLKNLF